MIYNNKINTKIVNFFGILFLLSSLINYYFFQTYFLIEVFVILSFLYALIIKKKFSSSIVNIYGVVFFAILILIYGMIITESKFDSFLNESYRFLISPIALFPFFIFKPNFRNIFKLILFCCRVYILYNLYEVLYINLIDPGGVTNTIFGDVINAYYNSENSSPYFLPQGEFGIPFIRPFGLWLQPQKSAFIFPIAIIVEFIYFRDFKSNRKPYIWYILYIISTVITGAKTSLIAALIIFYIIQIDFFKRIIDLKQFIFFIFSLCILFVMCLYTIISDSSQNNMTLALNLDFNALFNLSLGKLFLGTGFLNNVSFMNLGFVGESFLIRIIAQIGVIMFFLYLFSFIFSVIKKIDKINFMILFLLFQMTVHYAITNIYYFNFIIAAVLYYNNFEKSKDH